MRTAIAGYLIVVALTYVMFLRHVGDDRGLERIADQLMHYAMPVLFVIDWIVFVPKGRVPWTMIGTTSHPATRLRHLDSCARRRGQLVSLSIRRYEIAWPRAGLNEHGGLFNCVHGCRADARRDRPSAGINPAGRLMSATQSWLGPAGAMSFARLGKIGPLWSLSVVATKRLRGRTLSSCSRINRMTFLWLAKMPSACSCAVTRR